ncbi:hypothetical protein ACF3DV_05130 [Chlorogloeopsis fritschii PCC 9212]|uniref:hypothetical protein n=1 Tax=Chlorogloeopsis fritschii TaxID=1124 RepID=UPI0002F685AF|nr:hypothetical protein [Chlorogloeopsis fritschii]
MSNELIIIPDNPTSVKLAKLSLRRSLPLSPLILMTLFVLLLFFSQLNTHFDHRNILVSEYLDFAAIIVVAYQNFLVF